MTGRIEKMEYVAEQLNLTYDTVLDCCVYYDWPNYAEHIAWLESCSQEELLNWFVAVNPQN